MSDSSHQLDLLGSAPKPAGAEVIPFGKYKGEPVEVLLADRDYCDWLGAQPWFRERYGNVYQTIINYGGEPQDSPEHNEMQAAFLNDDLCICVASAVRYRWIAAAGMDFMNLVVTDRTFESGGWDVEFTVTDGTWVEPHRWASVYVELKPEIGDDFPSVLRQVKQRSYGAGRLVVARRCQFERVDLEQVRSMFAASDIHLLLESEILARAAAVLGSDHPAVLASLTSGNM